MRVLGWQTPGRNESKGMHVRVLRCQPCHRGAASTGQSLVKDLSKSMSGGTRKMVNYA
jgi:hypothetical protein